MDNHDAKINAIFTDVAEIKARQIGQDAKMDCLISDVAEIKLRQNALSGEASQLKVRVGGLETGGGGVETALARLEAKMDKRHAHMYRLLYTLIGVAVIDCGMLVKIAFF